MSTSLIKSFDTKPEYINKGKPLIFHQAAECGFYVVIYHRDTFKWKYLAIY